MRKDIREEFKEVCLNKKLLGISWEDISDMFGMKNGNVARCAWKVMRQKEGLNAPRNRILHISDCHYPFALPITTYKSYIGKVDTLVLNGDIQDCFAISKFIKKYRKPFINELVGTRQYIIDLLLYIKPKKVYINYGNHELRLLNSLNNSICEELMSLMPKSSLSLIVDTGFWHHNHELGTKEFYEPLTNIPLLDNIEINYTNNWYCRIGNTIFAHPSAYKSGILKTTEQAFTYFLQIGQTPFDCLVLAHTHNQGFSRYGKTFLYESGCTCNEADYHDGKMIRPQARGYLYLVQDEDDNLIYDDSKIVCLT